MIRSNVNLKRVRLGDIWLVVWQRFCEPCQTKNWTLSVNLSVCLSVALTVWRDSQVAARDAKHLCHLPLMYSSLCQTLLTARSVHLILHPDYKVIMITFSNVYFQSIRHMFIWCLFCLFIIGDKPQILHFPAFLLLLSIHGDMMMFISIT